MSVGLIWAQSANGVIGNGGTLPWHLPEDLARFRAVTLGSTVVMGRATWDALPERFRPLPHRRNVVLTRQPDWEGPGALVARSPGQALAAAGSQDIWVIGGASVFAAFIENAAHLDVTVLADVFPGDAMAPAIGQEWRRTSGGPDSGWLVSRTGLRYRTETWARADAGR